MVYVCKADNMAYRSTTDFVVKSANLAHSWLSCQTRILVGYLVGLVTKQLWPKLPWGPCSPTGYALTKMSSSYDIRE